MKRKYIFPIIKFWWKEFYNNLIQIGICGWALFGLTYLVGDYEWIGWFFIGLILVTATLSTVAATMTTIKKDSEKSIVASNDPNSPNYVPPVIILKN